MRRIISWPSHSVRVSERAFRVILNMKASLEINEGEIYTMGRALDEIFVIRSREIRKKGKGKR